MTASLPDLRGRPVEVRYQSGLTDTAGNAAHAATYIPQRLIVLDAALRGNKREHERILLHEVFHFVWVRLGNARRLGWEAVLREERAARARGEAGWSAEWRKRALSEQDVRERTRRWREYCCESFCDTAAWYFCRNGSELTLAAGQLRKRSGWFAKQLATGWLAI